MKGPCPKKGLHMAHMGGQGCGQKVLEKTRESAQNPIFGMSYFCIVLSAGVQVSAVWKPTVVAFNCTIPDFHLTTCWRVQTSDIW
jgi:hypothetical protein